MEILTVSKLKGKTYRELKNMLDYWEDLNCNIDYVTQPLASQIVNDNIRLLESKIIFREF